MEAALPAVVQRTKIQRVTGVVLKCSPLSWRRGIAWEASAAERSGLEQHAWVGGGRRQGALHAGGQAHRGSFFSFVLKNDFRVAEGLWKLAQRAPLTLHLAPS